MSKSAGDFGGMNLTNPINRIPPGQTALAVNTRAYAKGGFKLRNLLTSAIVTVSGVINTIARLNDTTPAGPVSGFSYIALGGTTLYSIQGSFATSEATGMSG